MLMMASLLCSCIRRPFGSCGSLDPLFAVSLLAFLVHLPSLLRKEWGGSSFRYQISSDRLSFTPVRQPAVWNLPETGKFSKILLWMKTQNCWCKPLLHNQLVAEKSIDLMSGKGNGLTILLRGAPGMGKAFAAEGVAVFAEKSLFHVTCGDVGTEEIIEMNPQSAFHLGKI